LAYFQSVFADH